MNPLKTATFSPESDPKDKGIADLLSQLAESVFVRFGQNNLPDYQGEWHEFFKQWIEDENAPLLLRRASPLWKTLIEGRVVFFCDNSPAHWSITTAFAEEPPAYAAIDPKKFLQDRVPLYATLSNREREEITKEGFADVKTLWKDKLNFNCSDKNWRVDHIKNVGIKKKLDDISLTEAKLSFLKLMSPANIFLTPKPLSGVGDLDRYVTYMVGQRIPFMADMPDWS